jgi:TolB-like protein/Tfp pilus assembly protein PilF
VCISDEVEHSVRNQGNLELRSLGAQELKNVARPVEVFVVRGAAREPSPTFETLVTTPRRGVRWAAIAAAALAGIGVLLWFRPWEPSLPARPTSVAVLPFADLSPAGDQEYFADGMAEELINALAGSPELRVVARTSAFAFRGQDLDVREIGQALGVGAVVTGSVRRAGDELRITAQLVAIEDGFHLWSESYDRRLENVFAIQEEIADEVAAALEARLAIRPAGPPTRDPLAHELYLRGLQLWNRRTEESIRRSIDYLEQAIELDPGYALAHAALADAGLMLWLYALDTSEVPRAIESAQRALALDPSLAEGHAALGLLRMHQWKWTEAELEFQRALAARPGYAQAHLNQGVLLLNLGRVDAGLAHLQRAARLDPLSPGVQLNLAGALFALSRYDQAIEHYERALELSPAAGQAWFGHGAPEQARRGIMAAHALAGRDAAALEALLEFGFPPEIALALRQAAAQGMEKTAGLLMEIQIASSGKPCTEVPSRGAQLLQYAGETSRALECLQEAYRLHANLLGSYPKVNFLWDPLRPDPRFQAILEGMGLAD